MEDELLTEDEKIREAWANYNEKLATSKSKPEQEFLTDKMRKTLLTDDLVIEQQQVVEAIKNLKTKKAEDPSGLCAEHLKLLHPKALEVLVKILQKIAKECIVPDNMKLAYKLMLPKPGKDSKRMDNFRGITVASILLKILESICLMVELKGTVDRHVSDIQVGFTNGRSPAMASLLISEAAAESKILKVPLYIASLDARKAFDVVNHHLLKAKLLNAGIRPGWWKIIDDLYLNSYESTRWNNEDSRTYKVSQGVKQGSLISPHLYKLYINDLLLKLENSGLGAEIGQIYIGTPTCADDVILLTNDIRQLQPMLNVAKNYADTHEYELHPEKTVVTRLFHPARNPAAEMDQEKFHLDGRRVANQDEFVHLGLRWCSNNITPDIENNIQKA